MDGRGNLWSDSNRDYIPLLEDVLDLCPAATDMDFSFGVKRVNVSSERLADDSTFPNLKKFSVATYMTKRAFGYLWARCPNLEHLSVESLSMTDAFPQQNAPAFVEFDSAEVLRLLRTNPMANLRELNVLMQVKDIKAAEVRNVLARHFFFVVVCLNSTEFYFVQVLIEGLPGVRSLSTLSIRVGLPQEEYPSQEQMLLGLAHVMQSMRQFKLWCADLSATQGRRVRWKWERFGFLESIAEIEQLNALIEPNV